MILDYKTALAQFERDYFTRLNQIEPNRNKAARIAGVCRETLYQHYKKLGISKKRTFNRGSAEWQRLSA